MDIVNSIVAERADQLIVIGRMLLGSFFILATVTTYLGSMQGRQGWTGLFIRLTIGFMLLQNYAFVMTQTEKIVESINQKINPDGSWLERYVEMSSKVYDSYQKNVKRSMLDVVRSLAKNALHNFVVNISFIFNSLTMRIMKVVQDTLLAILKTLGPILIPFLVFSSTQNIVVGWYKSYVEILTWPILWGIVLTLAARIGESYGIFGENLETFVAMNFALGFVILFSPMIVSLISRGLGVGTAASVAATGATLMATNALTGTGSAALASTGGMITGASQGVMQQIGNSTANVMRFSGGSMLSRLGSATVAGTWGGMKGAVTGAVKGVANHSGVRLNDYASSYMPSPAKARQMNRYSASSHPVTVQDESRENNDEVLVEPDCKKKRRIV